MALIMTFPILLINSISTIISFACRYYNIIQDYLPSATLQKFEDNQYMRQPNNHRLFQPLSAHVAIQFQGIRHKPLSQCHQVKVFEVSALKSQLESLNEV